MEHSDIPNGGAKGSLGVAAKLRRDILDGAYGYGDRLPPERELAEVLGASRTTVRSALQMLELERMVARRAGSGTFVVHGGSEDDPDLAHVISPLELIDVRLAVEPRMARLAVLNANARDLDQIAETLGEAERAQDAEAFTRWDQSFHLALAQASRNPLMVWISRQINHIRGEAKWKATRGKILTAERIAEYNAEHRAVFEAIRARDADLAATLMMQHLNETRQHLMGVQSA